MTIGFDHGHDLDLDIEWTEGINNNQVWSWPWPWKVRCKDLPDCDRGDFRCRRAVESSSFYCTPTINFINHLCIIISQHWMVIWCNIKLHDVKTCLAVKSKKRLANWQEKPCKCRHNMDTFVNYLLFMRGIHQWPVLRSGGITRLNFHRSEIP